LIVQPIRTITFLLLKPQYTMDIQVAAREAQASDPAKDVGDKFEIPAPEPFISFNALKDRIRHHYEVCSDYYYSMW